MGQPYNYDFEKSLSKKIMDLLKISEEKDDKGFPKRSIKKLVLTLEASYYPGHVTVYVEEYLDSTVGRVEVSYTIPICDDLDHCKLPEVGRGQS